MTEAFAEGAPPHFMRHDRVRKPEGYPFPGVVLWAGPKTDGREIVVVECTAPDTKGMVHIFSPKQLEHAP